MIEAHAKKYIVLFRVALLTGGPLGVILGPGLPPGGLVGCPMSCEAKVDQQPGSSRSTV